MMWGKFVIGKVADFVKVSRDRLVALREAGKSASSESGGAPLTFFYLTIFFYVVYMLAMQPGWVLGGEMWAEMATNYYPNANAPSYFQKFFATDAGYIPAPQRIVALIGDAFSLSAASIPYFYTWSAILLTAVMVGSFCLYQFRSVVENDTLRFLTAVAILIVADFETRTFINFTYFASFFIAVVTALAFVDQKQVVPKWAWFIPILMISKPAVLATIPAMILVSIVSAPRFRWITLVTIILCLGQFVQLFLSHKAGVMSFPLSEVSYLSKILGAVKYFFSFLGKYISGPNYVPTKNYSIFVGVLILLVGGIAVCKFTNKASSLIIIGLLLLFFNTMLNAFALSDSWNRDFAALPGLPIHRYVISDFFACILVVVGILVSFAGAPYHFMKTNFFVKLPAVLFLLWFVFCGWLSLGATISKEWQAPWTNNSQWQLLANAVDSGASPLCIPIDPFPLVYGRNCSLLNTDIGRVFRFEHVNRDGGAYVFDVEPPQKVKDKTVVSIGVFVAPDSAQIAEVKVKATIRMKNGDIDEISGRRSLTKLGGVILLSGKPDSFFKDIAMVSLVFSGPVSIAFQSDEAALRPSILWMGY